MRKKILIWRKITSGNELDIFNRIDYKNFYTHIRSRFNGICPNWGNKLWFQGLYSAINNGENEIYFRENENIEEINERYDLIIYPMANIFGAEYAEAFEPLAHTFSQINIPVFIVACGVQASEYSELDSLVKRIGESSKKFIDAIYKTGGEFALRGEFTKEFFGKLGFHSAVVTGCPSLYQLGPDFSVNDAKVEVENLLPTINGKLEYFEDILRANTKSIYIDQDRYFNCLYNPTFLDNTDIRSCIRYSYIYNSYSAELLSEGRIQQIADMNDWYCYLKEKGFNFSIGTRIHGNIMSILSGIPATVVAIDTRTQEMAEFFDIPYIVADKKNPITVKKMIELYEKMDYSAFNQKFKQRYYNYEEFLRKYGIVNSINTENSFFKDIGENAFDSERVNQEKFRMFSNKLKSNRLVIDCACKLLEYRTRN